jgi:hypothetical protein
MKTIRRSLAVVVMLASVAGFQSAATSAMSGATVSPMTRTVTGCCYVNYGGIWICKPC